MIRWLSILGAAALAVSLGPVPAGADSPFELRGVIEGFYGPPWPKESRLAFLEWMADHEMNVYVHAPKNDPYQRLRWRDPYPEDEMTQFAAEIALIEPKGLAWVPSISPGFPLLEALDPHDEDICFSCPEDRAALLDKIGPFWEAGARSVMISFDDVVKVSTHLEDAIAYGIGDYAYGVMNGDLLNFVYETLEARAEPGETFRLITVPADYFGVTTTPYLEGLRAVLRPEVVVMWTGVLVVSPTISCVEAEGFAKAIGRKPLLWDNFPVNDYAPYKLMVGPYAGRAPDLGSCLAGILSNPANQVRANRIPLYTVADYLLDPEGYDPETSWEDAVAELAGTPERRELLATFVENVRSTALDRTESVRFTALRDAFLEALEGADWPEAHAALVSELESERDLPESLRDPEVFPDTELVSELECEIPLRSAERICQGSWLDRLERNARAGLEATAVLAATRPDVTATLAGGTLSGVARPPAGPAQTLDAIERLAALRADDVGQANVHGDRFFFALGLAWALENRMDAYLGNAVAGAAGHLGVAAIAAREVTVQVDGQEVPTEPDGSFDVPIAGTEAEVVVTDGAGRSTRRRFAAEP